MLNVLSNQSQLTMSSVEIAELTGKRHDHVVTDVRNMLTSLQLNAPEFSGTQTYGNNNTREVFNLPKDLTLTLITGYSIPIRHKINQRWLELEGANKPGSYSIPQTFSEALRLAADLQDQRDEAIRTKAWISDKKTATAMNTASQAVKQVHKLEIELDKAREYCSIKRATMLYHGQTFDWRLLKATSIEMGIPPMEVFDANYGTVKAYHADVWREAYALDVMNGGAK